MRFIRLSLILMIGFIGWGLQARAAEVLKGKLLITGSSTIAPLTLEMAKRFEKQHPAVRIDVQTGGSSRGIHDAQQGLADIGMVSRSLHEHEKALSSQPIAVDGVAIIIHKSNTLQKLTRDQILAIYRGQIKNWKDVGGQSAPIVVVNKAEGRSTLELFTQYLGIKNSEIKAQVVIGDNEQGIKTVMNNPYAIGYVSVGTAEFQASHGVAIRLLPLDGVEASVAQVQSGRYPLSRPLNLVTKGEAKGLAKAFIQFSHSAAVADLVKEQYFVPIEKTR